MRPTIVAPAEAEHWSAADRRAVLAHELAHVRRNDCLSHLLARVAVALHWPNPLVWWAERRLRAEREMAADDAALVSGSRASDYAGFLLGLAQRGQPCASRWPGRRCWPWRAARPWVNGSSICWSPGAADAG